MDRKWLIIIFLVISNVIFVSLWESGLKTKRDVVIPQKKYPLIGKRVLLPDWQNDIIINFLPLRQKLRETIQPYSDSFALYFEYLPTGTSIGINEDSEFTAASLLKVPVVMAYYHKKEHEGMKEDPMVVIQKNQLDDHYGDLYKKGAGYKISLGEAARLALEYSDNTASLIIAGNISDADFTYVYEGLDIQPMLKNDNPVVTAQQYTSILKSLYFTSILNRDDSEAILDMLTKTKFNDKIPAGIPHDIQIAHKIGLIDKQIYQDCGIVYIPARPYAVCMISKSDKATANERMSKISKMIYEYVSQVK